MAADQGVGAAGAPAQPGEPLSREKILFAITKLLAAKDVEYANEVQKKAAAGTLQIKGVKIGEDVVREALAKIHPGQPPPPALNTGAAGQRWTPDSATAAALATKAMGECEDAEPYNEKVRVVGGSKVAVLPKPDVNSIPTGEYVPPDVWVDVVARVVNRKDGRVYVRLRTFTGWVSSRSRKDFSRVVLTVDEQAGKASLEPPAVLVMSAGRALRLLTPFTKEGRPLVASNMGPPEPRRFRTVIMAPILSQADYGGASSIGASKLNAREEFMADGAYLRKEDGRCYLHLQDGRGWVCERARADFSKLAVEPCGPVDEVMDDMIEEVGMAQPLRARAGGKKVIMVERRGDDAAAAAATDNDASLPGGVTEEDVQAEERIFRSDLEIWPEDLGPAKPIGKNLRFKLRRLYSFYGVKVKESEEDIKELTDKASTWSRACAAQKELLDYAEKLRKDVQKVKKEWTAAVKSALQGLSSSTEAAKPSPAASGSEDKEQGCVMPVQIRGSRWYCAAVGSRPVLSDDDDVGASISSSRHMGPLRPREEEAVADLKRMLEVKRKNTEASDSQPAAKKSRSKAGAAVIYT